MLSPPFTGLVRFLSSRYGTLGRPIKLAPMTFDFRVSNNLFEYVTTGGRFLLKVMAHPQALFGEMDVRDRLELVGRALFELAGSGMPVEHIVAGDDRHFVYSYQSHLLRLYRFFAGRGYECPASDMPASAQVLRALHRDGLSRLDAATRADCVRLGKMYPLSTTAPELPDLHAFVREHAPSRKIYAAILEQWETVESTVRRVMDHRTGWEDAVCLLHTDCHPRNVLFAEKSGAAMMIDLDHMFVGPSLQCLAFSVMRFAFYEGRSPEALQQAIATFAPDHYRDQQFIDELLHAMLYVEVEKILRILARIRTTGQYAGFVENIPAIHLPNIKLLTGSVVCA